jgi:hypothetical protein
MTPVADLLLERLRAGATGTCAQLADANGVKRHEAYYALRELEAAGVAQFQHRAPDATCARHVHVWMFREAEANHNLPLVKRALLAQPPLFTAWMQKRPDSMNSVGSR